MTNFKRKFQKLPLRSLIRSGVMLIAVQLLFTLTAFSQQWMVTGKVTDSQSGEALPGVNVILKGTTRGTITKSDGTYSIDALTRDAVIAYSFIGYTARELPVDGRNEIDVQLNIETTQLDEVVAIGYGTVRKRDITGSVSSVKGSDLQAIPVASAEQAIAGKLAGVQVLSTEGSPDAEIKIRVRGGGSITQDNSPLFIVDGFPVNNISDIAPSDIQTIDVLKDASSTAIYGSRGANGVIIVTTKSGVEGKVTVSFNSYYGLKRIANTLDVLGVEDYVNWQYEYAVLDEGIDELESYEKYFGSYQDIDLFAGKPSNNWQLQTYGRTGEVFSNDVSVRGGTEKLRYSLNYANINEKAIMVGSDYKRDNISFKLDADPVKKINLAFSMRYSDTKINGGGANEQNEVSSADSRLKHSVTYTPIPMEGLTTDDTDEEISNYLVNPLIAVADNDRQQFRKNYNLAGSFSWELINNVKLKTELGLDNYYRGDNRFYGLTTYYIKNNPAAENQGKPAAVLKTGEQLRFRNTNTLAFDFKGFLNEDHSATLLLGQELIEYNTSELTSVVHGYPGLFNSDQAFKLTSQGVANSTDNYFSPDDKLLSYFGRFNYDFQGRYLLSATFRADGSSKFSEGNRWGYFPSVAAAWRISQEAFMEGTSSWLYDLKLRLSYGTAGNNNIPAGQMTQSFISNSTTWMSGFENYWSASKTMANPDLKWETTKTRNIGLDYSLFNNKLSGSIEAYLNNTEDLLIQFPVAGTGYDTQYRNMGETTNKGLEFSVNYYAVAKKDYALNFNFNIGFNENTINSLGVMEDFGASTGWASTEIGTDFWVRKGGSVGEMYGYLSDGRYTVSDFDRYDDATEKWILKEGIADNSGIIGDLRPGMLKLKNLVGEDNRVTIDDRVIIGNANPKHTGGLTINGRVFNFDMSTVFTWSYGNDIYNANKIEYTTSTPRYQYRNMIDMMEDGNRWTNIETSSGELINDPAELESLNSNTSMWSPYMSKYVFSDWAVEDGSFLRLSTLILGYTLPSELTSRMRIQNLRFYVTGYNVLLLTNYSGFDPEVSTRRKTALTPGVDYSAYPRSRQLVFGLNLNF
jgi:TonB-dependent starch-binding outer membrane protein SusC